MSENQNPNDRQQIAIDYEDLIKPEPQSSNAKPKHPVNQPPKLPPTIKPRISVDSQKAISSTGVVVQQQPVINISKIGEGIQENPIPNNSEPKGNIENISNTSSGQTGSRINYFVNVGDKDINGYKIEYIYGRKDNNYLIYRIEDYNLRIVSKDASIISKNPDFNKLWMQIKDYLALDPTLKEIYTESLAYAVKNLYDGNLEIACNSLHSINESILRFLKRRSVTPYILGAFCTVLIALSAYFFAHYYRGLNDYENIIFSAVVLSSLGGLLSVGISLSDIKVDIQNNSKNHFIYGFARIIIAMISGVIVYYLIEGKIALSFIKDTQNINTYYIAFFASGFSEKLISNAMLSFEMKDRKDLETK